MAASPFSVRFDEELKARLEKQAELEKRSSGYIVQQAVENYLSAQERFYREIDAAVAEADKGIFISQAAMHSWMESWDTENELQPPEPDMFPDGHKK